ncbi:MAG: VCBS repeat-containing protein [Candidatus Delongbacteria bacterium]
MKKLSVIFLVVAASLFSQEMFTDIGAELIGVYYNGAAWGDYDNDGDLDIVLAGSTEGGSYATKIYRNDSGNFTDIDAGLPGMYNSTVVWGDYDNDGDLDIIHTVMGTGFKIYRNDSGSFTILSSVVSASFFSSSFGDFDNDGDLDILITGYDDYSSQNITKIYKNSGGSFTECYTGLTGVSEGSAAWGDYDNDGDLDILLTGQAGSEYEGTIEYISRIYRNDSGIFTDINAGLPGVFNSSAAWGDYDNDGDLDILLTGGPGGYAGISEIYRNDSGTFTDINAGLPELWGSEFAEWGDYDNDGDLDILLSGYIGTGYITEVFKNEGGGVFTDTEAGLQVLHYGSTGSWGDYDNDGDLDILLTGWTGSEVISKIYRNNSIIANNKPSMPDSLNYQANANGYFFSWNAANDLQTPQSGLSYNIDLRVNGIIIKPGMADQTTGFRRIPSIGNVCNTLSYEIENSSCLPLLPQETKQVEVKVQAVDHAFAGSEFAVLDTIFSAPDINIVSKEIMEPADEFLWEYLYPDSITNYEVQIDKDINFSDPITQIVHLGVGKLSVFDKSPYFHYAMNQLTDLDSLENNSICYWRMRPVYKNPGRATNFTKNPLSFTFNPIYYPPSAVSISVAGNYASVSWGSGKVEAKDQIYNVYSSDDPYAVFPGGWTYQATVNGTEWVTTASAVKKFYCVTAAGSLK